MNGLPLPLVPQSARAPSLPLRAGHQRSQRLPGFDVVRGVALIGVVLMNYYGYGGAVTEQPPTFLERLFNPWVGVLSTRFAATFVTVAGVGVVLMTNRARLAGDRAAIADQRWRLIRRGLFLLAGGYALDWIWQGTILFYYGAYFVVGALLITLRIRWLLLIGALSAAAAWAIQIWAFERNLDDRYPDWLFDGGRWGSTPGALRSPRDLVTDIWVNGTHPLFPWLVFFCCGMILGRLIPHLAGWRWPLVGVGAAMLALGYSTATILRVTTEDPSSRLGAHLQQWSQTDPFSRTPLYVVTTMGSSIIAVLVISWIADRFPASTPVDLLRRAGQLTLSLYLLHVLVFRALVDQWNVLSPSTLGPAMAFAVCFWAIAILLGAWWHRFVGDGPLEVLYRRIGG